MFYGFFAGTDRSATAAGEHSPYRKHIRAIEKSSLGFYELNAQILLEILKEESCSVAYAKNGTGAVRLFKESYPGEFDVILNDTLGHRWGDILLEEAARRITEALGVETLLVRVGGDEVVAATKYRPYIQECGSLEGRVHEVFEELFILVGKQIVIGVSIGCVRYPKDGTDIDTLMHKADQRIC